MAVTHKKSILPASAASEVIGRTGPRLALGLLVGIVPAVVVTVANPNRRYALVVVTLELTGRAGGRRTARLVLAQRAVGPLVAPLVGGDAARGDGGVARAPELVAETHVLATGALVRAVAAVVGAVAQVRRMDAVAVPALVLPGQAFERRAVGRLVAAVAAVVLSVAPVNAQPCRCLLIEKRVWGV